MKKLTILLVAVILTASVSAQAPDKMSYQAVVRDGSNALVTSTAVGMQISILQGTSSGTAVYVETQTPTTNTNGLVSLEIGAGTVVSGNFTNINWANGPYFIKTETDPTGGTSYSITGISQLLSVPYALHAKTAENISGGNTGWALSGNAGTDANINFIGTTDNQDVVFKRNNILSGIISSTNTALGQSSLTLNTSVFNTALGARTLSANTTGDRNTAVGGAALRSNTAGTGNTAVGVDALGANLDGVDNTAIGKNALLNNTTGNNNTANGVSALFSNTTGNSNTANGTNALFFNTTGNLNTANGVAALANNTTGFNNTANGTNALFSNTTGVFNTANGESALSSNTTGSNNTANGMTALSNNTIGFNNTANGRSALFSNTTGIKNTANGTDALKNNTTGNNNTAIGFATGLGITTGNANTILGANVAGLAPNLSNNIIIADGDGIRRINVDAAGNVGIGTIAPTTKLHVSGNAIVSGVLRASGATWPAANTGKSVEIAYDGVADKGFVQSFDRDAALFKPLAIGATELSPVNDNFTDLGSSALRWKKVYAVNGSIQTSDRRMKKDINDIHYGLNSLMQLRPVSYKWKQGDQGLKLGLIAQEVQKVLPEVVDVGTDENKTLGMNYSELIPVLIKAIQELKTENSTMKAETQSKIEALVSRLNSLESRLNQ